MVHRPLKQTNPAVIYLNSFGNCYTWLISIALLIATGCTACQNTNKSKSIASNTPKPKAEASGQHLPSGLERPEITDDRVLDAMSLIPRKEFVPQKYSSIANADSPLPIGSGQTISQPFIVAYMSQEARVKPGDKVLEIGTGSGYQAAVLEKLGAKVFSIEIVEQLAVTAAKRLKRLGYNNVHVRYGDGFNGWAEEAPFDAILITAAAPRIPEKLFEQLGPKGRMILPLKDELNDEYMTVVTKNENSQPQKERKFLVRFVPMTGEIEHQSDSN